MIPAAGYLLAGGQSSRMGKDKALLEFDGLTLVERGLITLRRICHPVAILGNTPELIRYGRVIPDAVAGCGPLGGIVAALKDSHFQWNVILAVDVPFLPAEALGRLLAAAQTTKAVALIPSVDGFPQPLCAVYSSSALPKLWEALHTGQWKVMAAVRAAGTVDLVPFEEADWFRNLNTPEEFASAAAPQSGS